MAQLFIIPEEDYKVLKKYIPNCSGSSLVFVPEPVINDPDFPKEMAKKLRKLDGKAVDYDYGGEPDVYLDVITSKEHYALSSLVQDQAYEEFGDDCTGSD